MSVLNDKTNIAIIMYLIVFAFIVSLFKFYTAKLMDIFDMSKSKMNFNTFLTFDPFIIYKGITESTRFHAFDMSDL